MALDSETRKWLNLLHSSPRFVLRDQPDGGAQVLFLNEVPASDGFYWVHGKTILKSGQQVESVFHLDTDSGGELYEVFWLVEGSWYDHRDSHARAILGSDSDIFPFDWIYSVPLAEDSHMAAGLKKSGS